MNIKKLPEKIFKKGEMVNIKPENKRWKWYEDDVYRIVSHYLMIETSEYSLVSYTIEIHNDNLNDYKLNEGDKVIRWLVNVQSLSTGKYRKFSENLIMYNKAEMRKKKINELIKSE